MQSHHIQLDGQGFHYLTWGSPDNPPLLMLHGFPEYSAAWDEVATRLCDRFHCIAPDQRGYGRSWTPEGVENYATALLVEDMAALIEALDLAPVTLIGHDWGAAVAYGLAILQPDLVARLVIINGVHPVPFQRALASGGAQCAASQYIRAFRQQGIEDRLAENRFEKMMDSFSAKMDMSWLTPEKTEAYIAEWSRPGRFTAMLNWYRASNLRVGDPGKPLEGLPEFPTARFTVPQPHLLIWAAGDTALLPEATEGLEAFAPRLTRHEIDGADHWVCHQKPDEVAQAVRDWLDETG